MLSWFGRVYFKGGGLTRFEYINLSFYFLVFTAYPEVTLEISYFSHMQKCMQFLIHFIDHKNNFSNCSG